MLIEILVETTDIHRFCFHLMALYLKVCTRCFKFYFNIHGLYALYSIVRSAMGWTRSMDQTWNPQRCTSIVWRAWNVWKRSGLNWIMTTKFVLLPSRSKKFFFFFFHFFPLHMLCEFDVCEILRKVSKWFWYCHFNYGVLLLHAVTDPLEHRLHLHFIWNLSDHVDWTNVCRHLAKFYHYTGISIHPRGVLPFPSWGPDFMGMEVAAGPRASRLKFT